MREGEIVQVQGGHIIRATGRKDRHSKVYTAKGPRDRRVRLSAHTAIQFYDVQDRLGYDRPSKAVDWLMTKAKSAIDKLAHLPPFDPSATAVDVEEGPSDLANGETAETSRYEIQQFQNPMGFQGYPHQDLCLSLQSFQNPGLVHGQSDPGNPNPNNQTLFPVGFEAGSSGGGSWAPDAEMGHFSRLLAWNGGGGGGGDALQSSFHPPPSIRAWDDLQMGPTHPDHHRINLKMEMQQQKHQHPSMDGFMGFCIPPQMHAAGEDVHGNNNLGYNHNSNSSMSTDSSR